jgi:hypothetical protein
MGFLFAFMFITGCYKKLPAEQPYPFIISQTDSSRIWNPYQCIIIQGNGPKHLIDDYRSLFKKYGFSGNGYSLQAHMRAMIKLKDPELLNHLEFKSKADELLIIADSVLANDRFLAAVLPVFGSAETMEIYLQQAASAGFSE